MTRFTDGFPGSASHRISLFPTVACADLQEDMHCSCQKLEPFPSFLKTWQETLSAVAQACRAQASSFLSIIAGGFCFPQNCEPRYHLGTEASRPCPIRCRKTEGIVSCRYTPTMLGSM